MSKITLLQRDNDTISKIRLPSATMMRYEYYVDFTINRNILLHNYCLFVTMQDLHAASSNIIL